MTMEKVKVYELAKELGMDSIALLEKLKQLDIDVKNHMSSLGSEEVKSVREQVAKEKALLTKVTKTTKRKSVDEGTTVQKRVGTTVIRRRAKGSEDAPAEATGQEQELTEASMAAPVETQEATEIQATAPEQQQQPAPEVETKPATKPSAASTIRITHRAPVPVKQAPTSPPPVMPLDTSKGSGLKIPTLLGARNSGMMTKTTGGLINIVKDDPRRPMPKVSPVTRPGQTPPVRPNSGIVNLGKEAIDKMAEEELNFKKKGGAGGRSERDKDPTEVKVADYRAKKELIFLPKKKKVPINKDLKRTEITKPAAHKRVVRIENSVTVSELASRMSVKVNEIIRKLMAQGVMATMNQTLDMDTATLLATEYGFEIENVAFKEESVIKSVEDKAEELKPRPPIVTVMGHVDHGKTSLLDAIRSAKVAAGEAGGITQHIGAYTVDLNGKKITFIDTPGHEAFTVMRARGANVTDIVILVVAADDGVMPQTREAADHAKAAGVPIIVAVNKMDKPGANPDKVMKGLSEVNILSEAWGGENIFVNVSALKHTGIKELLEAILLQAEVLDLKANPNRMAEGSVLEARLDRGRGPVVNILVKKGTLKVGDSIVAGQFCGRVRAMTDDKGAMLKELTPGYAAELLGLEDVPVAGDIFNAVESESEARKLASHRIDKIRATAAANTPKMTLDLLFAKVQQGDMKELPLIVKTDVFGSTEAIKDSLAKLTTEKVKVKVLSATTGGISESDVMLASASGAIIIGFNVRPETKARALAEAEGVEIKCYSIIYELLDDVRKAMTGLLDKKAVEKYMGRAEVRELFNVPKIGTIAGCSVVDGKITRQSQARVLRDNRVIFTGKLSSLKRFKDDAKEVAQGYECGIGIENFNDLKQGDLIEAFLIEMVAQELDSPIAANTAKS